MSGLTGNIKSLLQIQIKSRHDSYTDQYHRIFMVKVCMAASMLLGLTWFKDTINCIVPGNAGIDDGFVNQACWINGFYVYRDLRFTDSSNAPPPWYAGYYGFSKDLNADGLNENNNVCKVSDQDNCREIKKTFYLQYQWFPFYIAALSFLFYLPYILFRYINQDMISLKDSIKALDLNIESLVKNFFNYQINPPSRMHARVIGNIFVKICYIFVNVIAFMWTDNLLYGQFKSFGSSWLDWNRKSHQTSFDYTTTRQLVKPGELLLPTFGICEVFEISQDKVYGKSNHHKFVCEISQNVLYQYVLLVLWFLLILGMILSSIGLIMKILDHVITVTCFLAMGSQSRRVYHALNLRECEYLEFVRRKNMPVYGQLIRKLKEERLDRYTNGYVPDQSSPSTPTGDEQMCAKLMEENTMF